MHRVITCLLVLFLLAVTNNQFAQDNTEIESRITEEDIIENLLAGLKSDNLGLQVSSVYYLGERKASKAVIPLMGLLKSDKQNELRIVAALALFKIGDGRGIYAIKQRAKFETNEQVKRMCGIFYNMYMQEQTVLK